MLSMHGIQQGVISQPGSWQSDVLPLDLQSSPLLLEGHHIFRNYENVAAHNLTSFHHEKAHNEGASQVWSWLEQQFSTEIMLPLNLKKKIH